MFVRRNWWLATSLLLFEVLSCVSLLLQPIKLCRRQRIILKNSNSVGIDLGTTYSLVSVIEGDKPRLLKIDGKALLPSVVRYDSSGAIIVGNNALNYYQNYTENTFHSVKRLIGRPIEDAIKTKDDKVFGKKKLTSLSISDPIDKSGASRNVCALRVPSLGKVLLPEEISAEVLKCLLTQASNYFGGARIDNAVITVPAYFDPYQRAATEKAGYLAGLKKVKLLKEPESAAMAYGLLQSKPQLVFVIDLGGGTFDVSVLEVGAGLVEVIATSGDGHLGGDDFDQVLVDWVMNHSEYFTKDEAARLKSDYQFLRELTEAASATKIVLSKQIKATIDFFDPIKKQRVQIPMTRGKFQALSQTLLSRMLRPIREVAIMAGINLPGESGLMGMKSTFSFDKEESETDNLDANENALHDLALKQKAGRQNARLRNKTAGKVTKEVRRLQRSSSDSTLSSFPGGQALDDVILVGGASRMPCVVELVHTLTGIDPKRSVSPDEAICLGAGILSGVLDGKIDGFQVVSPLQSALLRLVAEEKERGIKMPSLLRSLTTPPPISSNNNVTLSPELFKTNVKSKAYENRSAVTKVRLVTEDDEDVAAYLNSKNRQNGDSSVVDLHQGTKTPEKRKLHSEGHSRSIFRLKRMLS